MITREKLKTILAKYPELIEPGLKYKTQNMNLYGLNIDILFQDRETKRLAVQVRTLPFEHEHIGEIVSYQEAVLSSEAGDLRLMLVADKIPENLQTALQHNGVSWKEISLFHIKEYRWI